MDPVTTPAAQTTEAPPPPPAPVNGKAADAKPGPGLTGEALAAPVAGEMLPPVDASAKKAPRPSAVDHAKQQSELESLRRSLAEERRVEGLLVDLETQLLSAKGDLAEAKKEVKSLDSRREKLVYELRGIIRGGGVTLYDDVSNPPQKGKGKNKAAENAAAHAEAKGGAKDDDAWRSVKLANLTPAIPPGKLKLLAEHSTPILTLGGLVDFQGKEGEWWHRQLSGFGESGQNAVANACEKFWSDQDAAKKKLAASDVVPLAAAMGKKKAKKKAKPKGVSKRTTTAKKSR